MRTGQIGITLVLVAIFLVLVAVSLTTSNRVEAGKQNPAIAAKSSVTAGTGERQEKAPVQLGESNPPDSENNNPKTPDDNNGNSVDSTVKTDFQQPVVTGLESKLHFELNGKKLQEGKTFTFPLARALLLSPEGKEIQIPVKAPDDSASITLDLDFAINPELAAFRPKELGELPFLPSKGETDAIKAEIIYSTNEQSNCQKMTGECRLSLYIRIEADEPSKPLLVDRSVKLKKGNYEVYWKANDKNENFDSATDLNSLHPEKRGFVTITKDGVTLDCNGAAIANKNEGDKKLGIGLFASGRKNLKIINCKFEGFEYGFISEEKMPSIQGSDFSKNSVQTLLGDLGAPVYKRNVISADATFKSVIKTELTKGLSDSERKSKEKLLESKLAIFYVCGRENECGDVNGVKAYMKMRNLKLMSVEEKSDVKEFSCFPYCLFTNGDDMYEYEVKGQSTVFKAFAIHEARHMRQAESNPGIALMYWLEGKIPGPEKDGRHTQYTTSYATFLEACADEGLETVKAYNSERVGTLRNALSTANKAKVSRACEGNLEAYDSIIEELWKTKFKQIFPPLYYVLGRE
jgi:hypothetical protein